MKILMTLSVHQDHYSTMEQSVTECQGTSALLSELDVQSQMSCSCLSASPAQGKRFGFNTDSVVSLSIIYLSGTVRILLAVLR